MSFLVLFFILVVGLELIILLLACLALRQVMRWHTQLEKAKLDFSKQIKQGKASIKLCQQCIHHAFKFMPLLFPWRVTWQWRLASWVFIKAFESGRFK